MRVVELQDEFGIDHLRVVERTGQPAPGPGEVVVRIRWASLNYRDYLVATGAYNPRQRLPLVPGSDGAGEIVSVGERVTRLEEGDRVMPTFGQGWLCGTAGPDLRYQTLGSPLDGVLCEYMVLHEDGLVRIPEGIGLDEAATLPCAGVTAWNAVVEEGGLRPGDVVVVQGTGGVALFALQFARMLGASVIITSKSDAKLERCRALGADHTINYREDPEWGRTVRRITGGGADLVIDLGGADTLEQSVRAVRPSGRISLIGVLSGARAPVHLPLVVMQHVRLQGIMVGSREMHRAMAGAVAHHNLRPVIDRTFALDEIQEAFHYMESGRHFGKILVRVSS